MVSIEPEEQQPMSDDQELAKVLAGVTDQADAGAAALAAADDQAEEASTEAAPAEPAPVIPPPQGESLEVIKKDAILELRPLVDKLNLAPEEKFDTYLLLIRSTDDKTLIEPAHEAAKTIADEAHRAEALLNIIKEIDFLSNKQ